ncbi:MAG: FkbM family methyltransferase [Chlorobiaceae bacterium]|nr:FkbM family methyltransferase [Chlorobiaceae bacterium]
MVNAKHGVFVYNLHCFYCGRALELYGECSELEAVVFSQLVRKGDTVWEVGANIGVLAVPLAKMVGSEGNFIAFEPQPEVFNNLAANLALNGFGWARAFPYALGEKTEILELPKISYGCSGNFGGISLVNSPGGGARVECRTGDDMARIIPAPDFVKIDVEGMECDALRGMAGVLKSKKPVLYVENDRLEKSQELIELLWSYGYRCWWHSVPYFNKGNYFGCEENLYPNQVAVNMICVHSDNQRIQLGEQPISDSTKHPFVKR